MISFTFRDTPWRIDDEAHKAEDDAKTITLTCDEQPVIIIESPIAVEKKKSEAA